MKLDAEKVLVRAKERLGALRQATAEETLRLLRGFLRVESHRLRMLHRYGLGGMEVALARGQVVDALIANVYRLTLERYQQRESGQRSYNGKGTSGAAIVAVGGYGREELCPHSDIDLLILYDRSSAEFSRFLAAELIYLLWDVGLKVGHSWRTPAQCLEMARKDSSAENSLLDARLLAGSAETFATLDALLQRHLRNGSQTFVERKRAELEERYGRLGETVFLLEPNVKESPGGQRDFHAMHWLARGCWRLGRAEELVKEGVLTESDWQKAIRGYDWIVRVRNELHYAVGRRADQLTLDLQPEVAASLKFRSQKHLLPVEVFMRDYFLHAGNVHQVLRLVLAAALQQKGKRRRQVLTESPRGFQFIQTDGELRLAGTAEDGFPKSPPDMMHAFELAQRLRLRSGENLKQAVRDNLSMVRRDWQRSPEMGAVFLEMLRRPGWVGPALRSLHSCGLLGKYLPEFGQITRLMQHDYYHRYTTDEHTLLSIDLLDGIWRKPPPALEPYKNLTFHIADPAPLYLALLLHDVGKGLGGGHSEKGAQRAAAICERVGLGGKAAKQVELLVRHHLLLSHLSQRRDLSDRRVAQQAAETLGDLETLSMLTLLTYADASAVGPEVWTEWKNSLLWELFGKVRLELLGVEEAAAQEQDRLLEARRQVREWLVAKGERPSGARLTESQAEEWMEAHLSLLPPRYPLGHTPEVVARQIVLAKRAAEAGAAVAFLPEPKKGYTQLLLCCPDTKGLFARVAGTLAALEVNILGARLDTRKDGLAADVLWVSTPRGHVISDPVRLRRIGGTVEGVLQGTTSFEELVSRIDTRPLAPVLKKPRFTLDNEISERCTVLEVMAGDRLGFAYTIAKSLTGLGLNIVFARLSTEKTMAFDVLYVTEAGGGKVAESRWDELIAHLKDAIRPPGKTKPA